MSPFLADLAAIVGADQVLTEAGDLEPYARDATEDLRFPPEVVVRPGSTEEVAAVLRLATAGRIPVTPQGGRTGLSGGALAVRGGIALSLERMDRILDIDEANVTATVEAGVILQRLQEEVEARGLYYPPDPASRGSCQIGGTIAENAGGYRCIKYGVTRNFVLGLTAVLPDGQVIRTGGKLRKNVTGYDLTQLLVGSEGTLAVVTEAVLKLIALPAHRRMLLVPFASARAAADTLAQVLRRRITPSAAEYVERAAMEAAQRHLGKRFPIPVAEAQLILEVDGREEADVEAQALAVAETCVQAGAEDVYLADTEAKQREVWALRHCLGLAVMDLSVYKSEDTVVPVAALPELIDQIRQFREEHGVEVIAYGHAGDGNIHCNLLRGARSAGEWARDLPQVIPDLFRRVVALGGTITAEHGVGWVQKEYVPIAVDGAQIELWRRIKAAFDPLGILNPGKVFPDP